MRQVFYNPIPVRSDKDTSIHINYAISCGFGRGTNKALQLLRNVSEETSLGKVIFLSFVPFLISAQGTKPTSHFTSNVPPFQ